MDDLMKADNVLRKRCEVTDFVSERHMISLLDLEGPIENSRSTWHEEEW